MRQACAYQVVTRCWCSHWTSTLNTSEFSVMNFSLWANCPKPRIYRIYNLMASFNMSSMRSDIWALPNGKVVRRLLYCLNHSCKSDQSGCISGPLVSGFRLSGSCSILEIAEDEDYLRNSDLQNASWSLYLLHGFLALYSHNPPSTTLTDILKWEMDSLDAEECNGKLKKRFGGNP